MAENEIVAKLEMRSLEGPNGTRDLVRGETIQIGRSEGNDIRIVSPKASRFHTAFRSTPEGVIVQDLGSLNGTFVNGKLIGAAAVLRTGDKVVVAGTEFLVELIDTKPNINYETDATRPVELQVHRGSILVADIRGYTHLSESLPAQELTSVLRVWSERVTTVVQLLDGVVDKFIGDSVLAYWLRSANTDRPTDEELAERAYAASRRIESETLSLESSVLWPFAPRYRWRVKSSISSGEVIFGNVGRGDARAFTVFGDSVNIVFRLNDLCTQLGHDLLCDEETAKRAAKVAPFRFLEETRLEGRTEKVKVFSARTTESYTPLKGKTPAA